MTLSDGDLLAKVVRDPETRELRLVTGEQQHLFKVVNHAVRWVYQDGGGSVTVEKADLQVVE